jgi:hypothetical protein
MFLIAQSQQPADHVLHTVLLLLNPPFDEFLRLGGFDLGKIEQKFVEGGMSVSVFQESLDHDFGSGKDRRPFMDVGVGNDNARDDFSLLRSNSQGMEDKGLGHVYAQGNGRHPQLY